jgi:glycosyltransferase involved in cell wall biosynthesis
MQQSPDCLPESPQVICCVGKNRVFQTSQHQGRSSIVERAFPLLFATYRARPNKNEIILEESMRIAQIAPLYESVPPKLYGGTERVVSWLTEELVAMGHDVTLFASGDSLTTARLVPACPQALRLQSHCIDQLAHHVNLIEKVLHEHKKEKFDLIHFHIDYLHFPLSRRERLCQVTTLHGRLDIPDLVPLYRQFSEMPVISISDSQRAPLPWLNWKGTVHHGLPEKSLSLRSQHEGYLAFLGRISPEKGLDRAIEISRRAGIPLRIAAKIDRADKEYFEASIKPLMNTDLIEYIGEIGDHEKNEFLGNAMALVFPINWKEPFGIVMIEAMACGVPVIAYPGGSVPEVIEDGVNGFLVVNIESAVKALDRISTIDRNVCRRRFEERFTSRRMAAEYMGIYESLVKRIPISIVRRVKVPRGMARTPEPLVLDDGEVNWTQLESPSSTT